MFGTILTHLSDKIRTDLKRNLKGNVVYQKHRWNLFERAQVYCSTHYLKAMFFLWAMAGAAVIVAVCFRSEFRAFAATYLNGVTVLPTWMSNLLGSQLTIIGIVFPLVVGLISVLFEKKSSRIHIQSAYQLHSGYMFAGLSGLSLAAFILIGGLFSAAGDKYLNTVFAITALIWMLFNIVLSIWFFITSLNVLDDKKRDRLMLKYYQSEIVETFLLRSQINSWLHDLGNNIDKNNIKDIEILRWYVSGEDNMQLLPFHLGEGNEITDIRLWPFNFLLRFLRPANDCESKISLLPSIGLKNNTITLVASTGIIFPRWWAFFFRLCFIRGPKKNWREYRHVTRDFYGETYDALEDRNISTFTSATDRLVVIFTTLKNSFQYADGNYFNEYHSAGTMATFSQSFHRDFYEFSHVAVKSLETTGEYFRRVINIPFSMYRGADSRQLENFKQCYESLFDVWHALVDWKTGYGESLSVGQEQRHRELVKDFVGEWESWYMWRSIQNRTNGRSDDDPACLLFHLYQTAKTVVTAVMKDDRFASDHSSDMLLSWFGRNNFEEHFDEYRWHSFFMTPALLALEAEDSSWLAVLRGNEYTEKSTQATIFLNALTDVRLLTAVYILSHINQKKNVRLKKVIKRLLNSEIAYPTGAHNRMTPSFKSASDIIDSIIRVEYQNNGHGVNWYEYLSGLVKSFSALNETDTITGRIYLGTYEDVRDFYGSYADIAFYLTAKSLPVSRRVLDALNDNLFSYHTKEQIINQLQGLKRRDDSPSDGYLMSEKDFKKKIISFNQTLEAYIQAFSKSMRSDLFNAEVDTERLKNTDIALTRDLPGMLSQDALLSLFSLSISENGVSSWKTRSLIGTMPKNIIARNINSNIYGELASLSAVKRYLLHDVYHVLNQMPVLQTENVRDVDSLLKQLRELTVDNEDYTLIFYGAHLGNDLRELTYHEDRHAELGITLDMTSRPSGLMPLRINNCGIYQVWDTKGFYSLLVRNSIFGNLHLHRDPDGLIFSSSWRADSNDPLMGSVVTIWKQELEIKGSVVARFEHH